MVSNANCITTKTPFNITLPARLTPRNLTANNVILNTKRITTIVYLPELNYITLYSKHHEVIDLMQ
jgi:hypothetical protein